MRQFTARMIVQAASLAQRLYEQANQTLGTVQTPVQKPTAPAAPGWTARPFAAPDGAYTLPAHMADEPQVASDSLLADAVKEAMLGDENEQARLEAQQSLGQLFPDAQIAPIPTTPNLDVLDPRPLDDMTAQIEAEYKRHRKI